MMTDPKREVWVVEKSNGYPSAFGLKLDREEAEGDCDEQSGERVIRYIPAEPAAMVTREHREAADDVWRRSNDPAGSDFGPELLAQAIASAYAAGQASRAEVSESELLEIKSALEFLDAKHFAHMLVGIGAESHKVLPASIVRLAKSLGWTPPRRRRRGRK